MEHASKKSTRRRRSFTPEFKAEAVRLVLDEGKSVSQVAKDLDLTMSALSHNAVHLATFCPLFPRLRG